MATTTAIAMSALRMMLPAESPCQGFVKAALGRALRVLGEQVTFALGPEMDVERLSLIRAATPGLSAVDREQLARRLYLPLADRVLMLVPAAVLPLVVSAGGLPGTGKSTLIAVLGTLLEHAGLVVAAFSLDDLYLDRGARAELARSVHPLFAQRGVPGTHDVQRGLQLVARLKGAGPSDAVALPRFDKLMDTPLPEAESPVCVGRPDVILIDGWCWGARPGDPAALDVPINRREAGEDPDGSWRRAVHRALGDGYPEFFALSDFHVQLIAPSHEASVRFRVEQERQDRRLRGLDPNGADPERIRRFLELFERVGRLPLHVARGLRVTLGEQHRLESVEEVG